MRINITSPDWDGPVDYEWFEGNDFDTPDATIAKWTEARNLWNKAQDEMAQLVDEREKVIEQERREREAQQIEHDRIEVERLRANARQPD